MYLINTAIGNLEEFVNPQDVSYAILSHRWEEEEVSFEDMQVVGSAEWKKGYRKIKSACLQALADGYGYIWVDTCCIDKRSSAELSEAINSMYTWYKTATTCYAYLADVHSHPLDVKQFTSSVWFTRSWTLQELLAPKQVAFYNSDWAFLGWKNDLVDYISLCTGVPVTALTGTDLLTFSVSQRMKWAARRRTTRVEDRAYSLMGIFNVNMPLLYGEGYKAFIRLQEEILKHSDDDSIFAWIGVTERDCGLLAPSLDCFADIPLLEHRKSDSNTDGTHYMTNRGISVEFKLEPYGAGIYVAALNCKVINADLHAWTYGCIGIYLRRLDGSEQYCRVTSPYGEGDVFIGGTSSDIVPTQILLQRLLSILLPEEYLLLRSIWQHL